MRVGLKDLGSKECFLIGFPIDEVREIAIVLKTKFNERWKKAQILK
jgi:hypothetical protein